MKIIAILAFLICCVSAAGATTYYVDYSSGSDSATGTTKSTPWKRCPVMAGFSGSYRHSAGDQFIFKGGVTWPNACFPLSINNGGSAGSVDYYGVDNTWYTGSSWAKPIFDLQNTETASSNRVIAIANGLSYITIDNIEITGFYWTGATTYGYDQICGYGNSTYLTFSNLYIHSWTHGTTANGTTDQAMIFVGALFADTPNVIIEYCTIDGSLSNDSMYCFYGGFGQIRFNTIHGVANGMVVSTSGVATNHQIHDNSIYNIVGSFDPAMHGNAMLLQGPGLVYNNLIYSNAEMHLYVDVSNVTDEVRIYNNVCWNNTGVNATIVLDDYNGNCTGTVRVYNNTATASGGGTGSCMGVINRSYTISTLIVQNNHFISSNVGSIQSIKGPVTNYTYNHNVEQTPTQATTQGYTMGNKYAPTAGGSTIDAGVSESAYFTTSILGVSRPQGAAWDAGAYELAGNSGLAALAAPTGLRVMQ